LENLMVRKFALAVLLLAPVLLAACASDSVGTTAQKGGYFAPPDPVKLAPATQQAGYRVGPMDVLDITVFQVPDLTRSVQVDAAGQIILPLIGSVNAAGKTVTELQEDVSARLREKYLQSPEVTIYVKEFASQKVTVEGAVVQPGVYPITGRTTLLQAVAMARGPDRVANESRVVVFRTINNQRMGAMFDIKAIRAGTADDPEVYGNDVVVVERSGMRSIFRDATGAVPLLGVFGPAF
jgi:polysaccharide export outer membrane protein